VYRISKSLIGDSFAAFRELPDVFWGAAHRLPLVLPASTGSVVTIHDLCWREASETMRKPTQILDEVLMGHAARRSARVIAVSESTARQVLDEWPSLSERLRVIPLAADLPSGDECRSKRIAVREAGYFLFVGTWEPRKNIYRLLEAYRDAGRGDPHWPDLIVCGRPGWGGIDPREESRRLGIGQKVHIVGGLSDQELATLYRHSLCLVMPSVYEGFGLPLLEAMAQGRPVLTSNCASMPEVAGDAGFLVNPKSVQSIAEGLRVMAKETRLRENLAASASIRAQAYSWKKTAATTWQVLMEAAQSV
jgi:glycosyltransferase involved in cell wall biosynthesis